MPQSRHQSRPAPAARKSKFRAPAPTTSHAALLVDGSDHAFRQLVHALLAFCARHETVREGHAAAVGLTAIECSLLMSAKALAADGAVSVRALAAHLHLSGAFVTTVSNKLQAAGLLEKRVDSGDRRRLSLVVTPAGEDLLARLRTIQREVNDVQFDCLDTGEVERLLASVDKLVESSDRAIALQRYLQPPGYDRAGKQARRTRPGV